jgi:segregation and condensation protein B
VGRPGLYATTRQFLDDLGIASLDQLPELQSPAQQAEVFSALEDSVAAQPALPMAASDGSTGELPLGPPSEDHGPAANDEAEPQPSTRSGPDRGDEDAAQAVET